MARSVAWRRTVSDAASWHQDQAQSSTIYILRETGPTGFLLKEEGEAKKFKVFLGDPHTCTCPVFKKEKDLCKHICWVLLKKFRVPRENPITFQLGLVEREINEILRGFNNKTRQGSVVPHRRSAPKETVPGASSSVSVGPGGREVLSQREITGDDVCPICQDELLNAREAVTYCRYGCAKSIHIKCMKVWAEHQRSVGEVAIRCPLCREDFGQLETLQTEYRNAALQKTRSERMDVHSGASCQQCNKSPIQGKCYRCTDCFTDYFLCHACFLTNVHSEHSFKFRQKMNQRWRPAQRGSGAALPQAVMDDLLARDISDGDYDLLLQLDSQAGNQPSNIPEKVIKSFPTETVRQGSSLLQPGVQCRVCLQGYAIGQTLRRLPCRHKFHTSCIDPWLLHQHPTCPVDGSLVWCPDSDPAPANGSQRSRQPSSEGAVPEGALEIPGIGVTAIRQGRSGDAAGRGRLRGRMGFVDRAPSDDVGALAADFALTGMSIVSSGVRGQPQSSKSSLAGGTGRVTRPSQVQLDSVRGAEIPVMTVDAISATASANNTGWPTQQDGSQGGHDFNMDALGSLNDDRQQSTSTGHLPDPNQHQRFPGALSAANNRATLPDSKTDPGSLLAKQRVHARGGARARRQPRPTPPLVERSSAPSIPRPPRESGTGQTGGGRQHSSSAPSLQHRTIPLELEGSHCKPPLPTGSAGSVRDRGRSSGRGVHSTPTRVRSASKDRSQSRDRLHPTAADKQQVLEGLFLGSSSANHQPCGSSGQVRGQRSLQPRSRVSPLHGGSQADRNAQFDQEISGSGLSNQP